jgi:hypothetical protein
LPRRAARLWALLLWLRGPVGALRWPLTPLLLALSLVDLGLVDETELEQLIPQ